MAEKVFVVFFIIGLLMNFLEVKGYALLIGLSITFLSILYFLFGFLLFNDITIRQLFKGKAFKGISTLRMLGSIGAGIFLAFSILGVMFSILRLEGAGFMLLFGISSSLIITLIVALKYMTKGGGFFYINMLVRSGIICLASIIVYLI